MKKIELMIRIHLFFKKSLNLLLISDLIQFRLYSIFKNVIYTHCLKKNQFGFIYNKNNCCLFCYIKMMNSSNLIYKSISIYFHLRKVVYTN